MHADPEAPLGKPGNRFLPYKGDFFCIEVVVMHMCCRCGRHAPCALLFFFSFDGFDGFDGFVFVEKHDLKCSRFFFVLFGLIFWPLVL